MECIDAKLQKINCRVSRSREIRCGEKTIYPRSMAYSEHNDKLYLMYFFNRPLIFSLGSCVDSVDG